MLINALLCNLSYKFKLFLPVKFSFYDAGCFNRLKMKLKHKTETNKNEGTAMSTGSNSELQLENEFFRVTKWTILPGGHIPMHKHLYEYVVVPMMTGEMHVANSDGSTITAKLQEGVSYTRPGGAEHQIENHSVSETVVFVEVERLS